MQTHPFLLEREATGSGNSRGGVPSHPRRNRRIPVSPGPQVREPHAEPAGRLGLPLRCPSTSRCGEGRRRRRFSRSGSVRFSVRFAEGPRDSMVRRFVRFLAFLFFLIVSMCGVFWGWVGDLIRASSFGLMIGTGACSFFSRCVFGGLIVDVSRQIPLDFG